MKDCCSLLDAGWHVIAQSTGGAAVVDFLQSEPDGLRCVVLWKTPWDTGFITFWRRDTLQQAAKPVG